MRLGCLLGLVAASSADRGLFVTVSVDGGQNEMVPVPPSGGELLLPAATAFAASSSHLQIHASEEVVARRLCEEMARVLAESVQSEINTLMAELQVEQQRTRLLEVQICWELSCLLYWRFFFGATLTFGQQLLPPPPPPPQKK